MSGQLVWQIVKGYNSFVRKNLNGTILSAEPGNVYNKHSYKFSGLANSKTVDVSLGKEDAVVLSVGSAKNAGKPAKAKATYVVKKNARRALVATGKQAGSTRADLKRAAVGKMAAIQKSLRVKKATK